MKKKEQTTITLLLSIIIIIGAVVAYVVISNPFAPAGTWEVASEISGRARQDTTEFNMSSQWRLAWKIENGTANYFIAQVYARNSSDSSGFSLVAESDGSDSNTATGGCPVDFTGSFFIRVIADDNTSWSLQIQELVKPV